MREATFYRKQGDRIKCLLCPNHCLISEGGSGRCLSRSAVRGKLWAHTYARVVSASVDPIEKKPLYHLYPGRPVYSIGSYGCNMRCRFCQNSEISQHKQPTTELRPEQLVLEAKGIENNIGVAFTYNEPGIWYEYIIDSVPRLHEEGLLAIMVTNGYLNYEPWRKLCEIIDAMNIDLKAFNSDFYSQVCGGRFETVKENIKFAVEAGVHVELTHLVVTGLNDNASEFAEMVDWIAGISDELPLHISRYFPHYLETAPATSPALINSFVDIARAKLKFVYHGNLPGHQDTRCPQCDLVWVKRNNYEVTVVNHDEKCECGRPIPFMKGLRRLPEPKGHL